MYALKFISGKYQGGEFPLRVGRQLLIGRSSDLDMVLAEDMVSRKHARILVTDGRVVIEDLGSTNGTFVNGERVKQARLKEGDRVLIGTSIIKVVAAGGQPAADDGDAKRSMEKAAEASATKERSPMAGRIEEVPLPDLLQLLGTSKKSGVLRVKDGEREARVFLRQGRVYYATLEGCPDFGPLKAFHRIVRWPRGEFELQAPSDQEFMVEINEPTEGLLVESLRQVEELRALEPELPAVGAALALARPLNARLRDLPPIQLDVLQLAHETGDPQAVIDRYGGPDVEAAAALIALVKRGCVRVG